MESIEIKRVLRSAKGFDDVIIDTSPIYDSIVAEAWMAADLILSPVQFTEYNFNMSACLMSKMRSVSGTLGVLESWDYNKSRR